MIPTDTRRVGSGAAGPDPAGPPDAAVAELAAVTADVRRVLAELPDPAGRDPGQRDRARRALDTGREARTRFMTGHAEAVYDVLTVDRSRRLRPAELVAAAAERFPGLVPDPGQLAAEAGRALADRDGLEIDQGIFFGGVLRSATAGRHLIDTARSATGRALELSAGFRETGRVDLATLLVEQRGSAAHVTIQNGHCLNAEDNRLIADMETAVDLVALHDGIRVGVLRGGVMTHPKYAGRRVFSAGINLADLGAGRISYVKFLLGRELGYVSKLLHGVLVEPDRDPGPAVPEHKPWLAVVDSFAIGGGMQLLLVVDRVIGADDAWVSLPAAQEGIVPGVAALRLGRFAGGRLSRQILLGGRRLRATDPESAVFFDEVFPTGELDAAADRAAAELAAPAVAANRRMLALAEEPDDELRAYLAEFAVVQAVRLYADDVVAKARQRAAARDEGRPR